MLEQTNQGPVPAPPPCPGCGGPAEADANFCDACGAALDGVVCRDCGERCGAGDCRCAGCGAVLETPAGLSWRGRRDAAAAAVLVSVGILLAGFLLFDLVHGRHFLSTKDGRFQQEVQLHQTVPFDPARRAP